MPQLLSTEIAPSPAPDAAVLTVDVAIVGGGIVGLTLAAALRHSGLKTAVIEAQNRQQAASRQRAYAFSLASAAIFQQLDLWSEVAPQITHFQRVCLSDGQFPHVLEFSPQDCGTAAVYYAAEHRVLMTALNRAVSASNEIVYLDSAQVIAVERRAHAAMLSVQSDRGVLQLQAALVVAADGMGSPLRQQANITTFGWRYWQSCVTAVLQPEQSHQNIAYERFWPSGPFAILPLPDNRCQIVWTAPHREAEAIMALPPEQFMAALQQRYGSQMGHLTLVSQPLMFPVQLMQSQTYGQPRLALVGDAAHCCHPVGGQGLNMGIRDAAALAETLTMAHRRGEDIGSLAVLRRYSRWRQWENSLILTLTDTLTRCFSNQIWPVVGLRRLGLLALQQFRPLRQLALKLMTGRFGRIPQIPCISAADVDATDLDPGLNRPTSPSH